MPVGSSNQEKLYGIELLNIQQVVECAKVSLKTKCRWIETGKIPVVKFGNRTYCVPAGTVIEQLQQAGYSNLNETWKPGRCVSSTPPLLTKSSMFCSYTDGNICTPIVLLENSQAGHPIRIPMESFKQKVNTL